jgi:hypothetical protein
MYCMHWMYRVQEIEEDFDFDFETLMLEIGGENKT